MTTTRSLQTLDELLTRVSTHTGLSPEKISAQISAANINKFRLDDTILVDPEDCSIIIDAWANNIKASLGLAMTVSGKSRSKAFGKQATTIAPTPIVEATIDAEDTPIDSSAIDSSTLAWSDGFAASVNHQYGPSLKKILPSAPEQRQLFLEAIVQETQAGIALINALVAVMVQKYNGRGILSTEKAKAGVLKKANELLAQS